MIWLHKIQSNNSVQTLSDKVVVDSQRYDRPFITQALATWSDHTLHLALDTSRITEHLVLARTAVIYRGRAVPLAWQVYHRRSVMLSFDQYAPLIRYTYQPP